MSTRAKDIIRSSLEAKKIENSDQLNDSSTADVVSFQPTTPSREILTLKKNAAPIYEIGDLLVSYLEQIGVEYIFGVPGGAIEPLYNALARSEARGGVKAVIARHETGAAFMADGYARNTGSLGVCCSTTGPGATNLLTGVSSAYENNIPLLVLSAQTSLSSFGKGGLQESSCTGVNTVGMFQYCTRYNSLISHVDQVERKLTSAIMAAFQSPQGPSHLSFPLDVLGNASTVNQPTYDLQTLLWRPSLTDENTVEMFSRELADSKKTVFIVGDHCSHAIGTILQAAFMLDAKIITTPHGKGLVSPYHPLFRGVVGFAGHSSAENILKDEDLDTIVAIGTPLGEWESNGWDNSILNGRLIHVEATESNLTRSPMAKLHVRGTLDTIFKNVVDYLEAREEFTEQSITESRVNLTTTSANERHFNFNDEKKAVSSSMPIKPQRLMMELPNLFPANTRYLADSGNGLAWAIHYLHPYDRRLSGERDAKGGLFRGCLEFASMAWAIGASIGTALAVKDSPVVCITGDGSYLMSGQEVTTAIQFNLNVIYLILNDSSLGMVRHGQELGGAESIGHELPIIDFAKQAESLNIPGFVIQSVDDLQKVDIKNLCTRGGPSILDVRIDPDEVPPMGMRVKILHQM